MSSLLLLTRIGGRPAAFRAEDISSIVELTEIAPVPRSPNFVAGLAGLRSRALTVIDSRKALALPGSPEAPDVRAPVVEVGSHAYALLVDRVDDVVAAVGEPTPPPATLGPAWARVARGMIETAAGPAVLVDVAALIAGPHRATA